MRARDFQTKFRKLYHTSKAYNHNSILKTGLEPRNQEYENISREPGIFMFESLAQAREWAFYFAMTEDEPIDIWEVIVPRAYKLKRDLHPDMDIYNAVIGYETIPPNQLRLIKTQPAVNSSKNSPRRAPLIKSDITEGLSHPCIVNRSIK